MRFTSRRFLGFFALLTLFLFLATAGAVNATTRLSIATAGTAGTWYPLGGAWANLISKNIEGVQATAYPSGASIENTRALLKKQTDMAFMMPDVTFWAYKGIAKFEKEKPFGALRSLMSLYPIDEIIVVPKESPIKSLYDLKGKKVGLGAPGSGIEIMNKLILAEYGITYDDIDPKFLSIAEQVQGLKDGNLDIGMFAVGTPAPGVMDLQTAREVRFINIEEDMMKKINSKYPYYVPRQIPADIYKDQDSPIEVLSWMGVINTTTHLDKELVYNLLRAFWDNKSDIDNIHVKYKKITLDAAYKVPIPLHDGAVKFYKEKGVLK